MQIQLKQAEIVAALKQYIEQKGIKLKDKEVTITFTAGRKETGLSAELVIEESSIPGFTDTDEEEDVKPSGLTVVKPIEEGPKAAVEPTIASIEEPEAPAEEDPPVVKTNSLFN